MPMVKKLLSIFVEILELEHVRMHASLILVLALELLEHADLISQLAHANISMWNKLRRLRKRCLWLRW